MIQLRLACALPLALTLLAGPLPAQVQIELQRTGGVQVLASSPDGTWVTGVQYRAGPLSWSAAFRWSAGTGMKSIASYFDGGRGITADGGGVLSTFEDASGKPGAGIWSPNGVQLIGGLGSHNGGTLSVPGGMSADGRFVAAWGWLAGGTLPSNQRGFLWSSPGSLVVLDSPDGHATQARDVSDDGNVVVGNDHSVSPTLYRPLRWEGGVPAVLAGEGDALATSSDGAFVTGISQGKAFRWSAAGGLVLLETLPPSPSGDSEIARGLALSDDGEAILGNQASYLGTQLVLDRQFVWRPGAGAVELRTLLETLGAQGLDGFDRLEAASISSDGRTLVGTAWPKGFWAGNWIWSAALPPVAEVYCTAQTSSAGCTPSIGFSGTPSARTGAGFLITSSGVQANASGALVYGTTGPASVPFGGGVLCVQAPLQRVAVAPSGGSGPCDGTFDLDFNAYVAGGGDPRLVAGANVWAQFWSRDQGAPPPQSNLSDALTFTLWP